MVPFSQPGNDFDAATEVVLEARGVGHAFGSVRALDGVDLDVRRGECLALVGESGSGKTTLLRTFNRLVDPNDGEIRFEGRALSERDPIALRRGLGYVPQGGGLLPHWTVRRNVALVPRLLGRPAVAIDAAIDEALSRVGLDPAEFGDRYPRSLSGGQRQRVALARALVHDPPLLLLDEPFGALDALTRSDLQRLFRERIEADEVTAVLVTHDLAEARRVADRIAVLREGRLLGVGSFDALRDAPPHPWISQLFARAGVT